MSETQIVEEAVSEYQAGHPISDLAARVIAAQWHGGQSSGLYSLASCGAITDDTINECEREAYDHEGTEYAEELNALNAYVMRAGLRGRQDGWSNLHW